MLVIIQLLTLEYKCRLLSGYISLRLGEYTFLNVDKPDSNLFQSLWLFYFMKMFYCYLLTTSSSYPKKISQIWSVCLWFSRKINVKRNLIGYWKMKDLIWWDSKSPFFPHPNLCLARVISLSRHLPGSICCRVVISQVLKTS